MATQDAEMFKRNVGEPRSSRAKEEKSKRAPFNRKGAAPNAGTHARADSSGAEA